MSFITENWQIILGCVVFVVVAVAMIILYRKNAINEAYLEMLAQYLDQVDDGEGVVPLLCQYAKRAVRAVEQMVKAGILAKTNEARKDMAMQIVKEFATADGIELNDADICVADSLVEAEVFDMSHE